MMGMLGRGNVAGRGAAPISPAKVHMDAAVRFSGNLPARERGLINALAAFDERKSRVVELRFFGGLSVEETASVLKVSAETVMRDWRLAKAWLQREMRGDPSHDA